MSKSTVRLEINGGVRRVMHDKVNGSAHMRQVGGRGGGWLLPHKATLRAWLKQLPLGKFFKVHLQFHSGVTFFLFKAC